MYRDGKVEVLIRNYEPAEYMIGLLGPDFMEQITEINPYEANSILHQYLIFHYANDEDQFSYPLGAKDGLNFPERCVSEGFDFKCLPQGGRGIRFGLRCRT